MQILGCHLWNLEAQKIPKVLNGLQGVLRLCSLPTQAWVPAAGDGASRAPLPKLSTPLVLTGLNTLGPDEARAPSSKGDLEPTQDSWAVLVMHAGNF